MSSSTLPAVDDSSEAAADAEQARVAPAHADDYFGKEHITVIEPRKKWQLADWKELVAYRDLFWFLTWRMIKVRYVQSVIGIGWAVIQPLFTMATFTIVFGRMAKISSDGAPYALFSLCGLVAWTYFSNALSEGVSSLIGQANMIRKVYFPRIMLPFSAVVAKLVDFSIALVCLCLGLIYFQHLPPWQVVFFPLMVALMVLAAAGMSVWLTALAIQYRDVRYGLTFVVQTGMYASPVIYPTSSVPEQYRLLYSINPMAGIIEGFRATLLGTQPVPWDMLAVGTTVSLTLLLTGLLFFRRKETSFADVA